ncbi:MAG: ribosome biogenesis GTPase Der [Chloroflexi bacterium]|nr:ribosome biogenesis GTPase Der [Chloroflexota bacterium]
MTQSGGQKTGPTSVIAGRKPVVAIVGRPNVGKSTLFNRIAGERKAIVEEVPGTTRDRLYAEAEWGRLSLVLIDTGGLEPTSDMAYAPLVRRQVETALAEADVILFVVDAREGITAADLEIAEVLRRGGKPTLLLANKADNDERRDAAVVFYELALGDPIAISAYKDLGLADVRERLEELLPALEAEEAPEGLGLAIIGRPNVGKSMLLNAVLGQERVIVSEEPGTTRDAIDTPLEYKGQRLVLVDTAGIRRPGKVQRGIEKYAVLRAQEALKRAEIALLVIEASAGVTAQDTHIAGLALEAHTGLIIVVNKWDLMEDSEESRDAFARIALRRLKFLPWAPLCFASAKTGLNLDGLLDLALEVGGTRGLRVPTHELNVAVRQAVAAHSPPSKGKRRLKVLYVTQADVRPPTFVFFVSDASLLHFSYQRYLENAIRKRFGFEGTAVRLVFRSRGGD